MKQRVALAAVSFYGLAGLAYAKGQRENAESRLDTVLACRNMVTAAEANKAWKADYLSRCDKVIYDLEQFLAIPLLERALLFYSAPSINRVTKIKDLTEISFIKEKK